MRYINASAENTTPVDKPWELNSDFGNGDNVYLANRAASPLPSSRLTTSVGGLSDGTYDVWAYFWSKHREDWRLRGGFAPTEMLVFRRWSSQHAESHQFAENVKVSESGMGLYRAYIGRQVVGGETTEITVHIGEFQGQATVGYDGIGVARVEVAE